MKREDIKELWELCGWKHRSKSYEASVVDGAEGKPFDVEFWYFPDEPNEPQAMPDLTLDNLVKYAFPKYVVRTGRDFMTIPTTLSAEELANRVAQAILKVLREK